MTRTQPRPRIVAPLVVGLLGFASTAVAQNDTEYLKRYFARYDKSKDGQVDKDEFPGSDAQFANIDANDNGRVTFAEFEASATAKRLLVARRKQAGPPRPRADEAELRVAHLENLKRWDPNRDGVVTAREWTGSKIAFKRLDANGDGTLSKTDLNLAKKKLPKQDRRAVPEFKSLLPSSESLLEEFDRNDDLQLSRRELAKAPLGAAFRYFDRNRDSFIDFMELEYGVVAVNRAVRMRGYGTARPQAYRVPFDAWDKNDDDRLETNEWLDRKYLFPRVDQNRDAAVTRDEVERYRRSVEGRTFVERFDLNDDGRVTLKEYGGSPDAFRRADSNGDGSVTKADN